MIDRNARIGVLFLGHACAAAALISTIAPAVAEPDPKLDMLTFFAGRTHAENVIKIALHAPHKLIVDSIGGRNKEGEFVLIDTVREEGKPERKRTWVMHESAPGHFTGVLSDAAGPVDVVVTGDQVAIRYVMKDGHLSINQRMQLLSDGKTLANHVVAKKFGLKFASVDGTVRKLD